MAKQSAGILLFRIRQSVLEVFLVHPGGPFFVKKDDGHWTIPKGEILDQENPLDAALREFEEETGHKPQGEPIELTPILQKGGKRVLGWAIEGDLEPSSVVSNTFELQWPPNSGIIKHFAEIDKGEWFIIPAAKKKINERQVPFLEELKSIRNL